MKNRRLGIAFLFLTLCATGCGTPNDPSTNNVKYTLRTALLSSPKAWNPHTWETSDENYIPSFTTMGFYQIGLNEERNGYEIFNEMALSAPKVVIGQISDEEKKQYGYVGQIGEGYIYDIDLNPNAKWEDGTPIKASDYLDSMEKLLSPKMANFRADFFYASNLVVANAETYFKQGKTTVEALYPYLKNSLDGLPTDKNILKDGTYYLNLGKVNPFYRAVFPTATTDGSFYTCLTSRSREQEASVELAAKRIVDATQYYLYHYVDHSANPNVFQNVKGPSDFSDDEKLNYDINIYDFNSNPVYARKSLSVSPDYQNKSTYELYTVKSLKEDLATFSRAFVSSSVFQNDAYAFQLPLFANMENVTTCTFDEVGLKAMDDYTLRFYLSQKISALDLQFSLTTNFLVKKDIYESLTKKIPGSDMYATAYATDNPSNYMSYGPYRLATFQKDKAITLLKNENWYGYHDGQHEGLYQCDKVIATIVKDHATTRQLFLSGQLDSLELTNTDMADFGKSRRVKYVPESYTQKISLNSDRAKLKSRQNQSTSPNDNKTILNNINFRKALSLSIDRKRFASLATAGSQAFTGLLNNQYLIDSKTGETYRSTKQGKSVYEKVYGTLGGENGGEMLNPEEVEGYHTDARSGYNKAYAINLVKRALEEESHKEDGFQRGNYVLIEFLVSQSPDESETVRDAMNYLSSAFNEITEPNGFKVEIKAVKDEDYYNTASNGDFDMIYSIWGGASNNPYGMMQVYIDPNFSKNCEYGFKGHQSEEQLEIEFFDGSKATKTYYAWFDDIVKNYVEPTKQEGETWSEEQEKNYQRIHTKRLDILAGVEAGVLSRFEAIPLVARSQASMNSFKVEDGTDNYITFVGYGGIRELKFNYTDSEWNNFLRKNGNNLTDLYKN